MRIAGSLLAVGMLAALWALVPRDLRPVAVVPLLVTSVPVGLLWTSPLRSYRTLPKEWEVEG